MTNFKDFKMKLDIGISHFKAKINLIKKFRDKEFTKDNLIRLYNYILGLGYRDESIGFIFHAINKRGNYIWLSLNKENEYGSSQDPNRLSINIFFDTSSPIITLEVDSVETSVTANVDRHISIMFNEEINMDTMTNKAISYETREFLSLVLEVLSKSFVYSVSNLKW